MNRHLCALGLCFLVSLASAALAAQDQPVRLAVMDFSPPSYWTPALGHYAYPNLGGTISELLTTHLVRAGTCEVVERSRLQQLLNERSIPSGRAVLDEQARDIGRELKVDAIVVGSFAPGAYSVEVTARTVAVRDGAILAAESIGLHWNPNDRDSELTALAAKLLRPWNKGRGLVLDVFDDGDKQPLLMLDLGTAQGCEKGTRVEILTSGDPVIHPVTHQMLGTRDVRVGDAAVVQSDKDFAYARVFSKEPDCRFERMTKVRLTGEEIDLSRIDADLSVLNARADVKVSTDIAGAQILVDGRPTKLEKQAAQVPLQAGSHLVELALSGFSTGRTVTVSKKGAEPPEVAFRGSEMLGKVAIFLPFPITEVHLDGQPQEGDPLKEIEQVFAGQHALIIPNLVVEGKPERATAQLRIEVKAGETLTISSLEGMKGKVVAQRPDEAKPVIEAANPGVSVPTNETFVNQLVAAIDASKQATDERTATLFLQGADLLKRGLRRNQIRSFRLAQPILLQVTQLDPTFALGQFALGLSYFYAYDFGAAKTAFDEAIRLDGSLEPVCPLLWWEDFHRLPSDSRVSAFASDWRWHVRQEGGICYQGGEDKGLVLSLSQPQSPWKASDSRTVVRFRVVGNGNRLGLFARFGDGSVYTTLDVPTGVVWIRTEGHRGQPNIAVVQGRRSLAPAWHTAEFVAVGRSLETYLDGVRLVTGTVADVWDGPGALSMSGTGEMIVDWVLVSRL